MHLTGSVGVYPATPNIERGEIMKFTTSSTRGIGSVLVYGVAAMVKSRDMVRNWSQIFEIVCSTGDFHAQNEVVYFFYIRNSFYREDWKRFVRFNAARKDVEKVKLWRTGAWLSVEGYSVEPPEREILKILTNRHHAGCQKFLTSGVYYRNR